MRNYFFLLLLAGNVSFCQTTKPIDTTFNALFDKMPQFSLSVEEAWQNYFPKNKMNACRRYEAELKQELNRLATLSNHQSRSLSMLAGKFDIESRQYDFTKVTITKDQQLDGAVLENDKSFYSMLTDYLRITVVRLKKISNHFVAYNLGYVSLVSRFQNVKPLLFG